MTGLALADDAPARHLYERLGFVHDRDREVIEGLWASKHSMSRQDDGTDAQEGAS